MSAQLIYEHLQSQLLTYITYRTFPLSISYIIVLEVDWALMFDFMFVPVHKLSVLKEILKHKLAEKRDEEMKRKQEIIKMEAMEEELPGEYHTLAQLRR